MSIIDKNQFVITCRKCGEKQEVRVLQKGSAYGGGDWTSPPPMKAFDAEWRDHGAAGPMIHKATCRACGVEAKVA